MSNDAPPPLEPLQNGDRHTSLPSDACLRVKATPHFSPASFPTECNGRGNMNRLDTIPEDIITTVDYPLLRTLTTTANSDPQVKCRSACTRNPFSPKAAISIWSSMLIISYAVLVRDAVARTNRMSLMGWVPYKLFMLFAFLTVALHVSCLALACRAAFLSYDISKGLDGLNDTHHHLCKDKILDSTITYEYLHLGGMASFILTVWASSLILFENVIYPVIFSALSLRVLVFVRTKCR